MRYPTSIAPAITPDPTTPPDCDEPQDSNRVHVTRLFRTERPLDSYVGPSQKVQITRRESHPVYPVAYRRLLIYHTTGPPLDENCPSSRGPREIPSTSSRFIPRQVGITTKHAIISLGPPTACHDALHCASFFSLGVANVSVPPSLPQTRPTS